MEEKKINYREAIAEIESILTKMENGQTDLDNLSAEIKRANELLRLCKEKLFVVEQEVNQILTEA